VTRLAHAGLDKLTRFARKEVSGTKRDWESALEGIGLLFASPPARASYDATPGNAVTFAHTGGDGVHFSFVLRTGEPIASAPVVMTVPMRFDRENLIVGADFRDFLALGMRFGFFCLEQVTYDRAEFLDAYAGRRKAYALGRDEKDMLTRIARAFDVKAPKNLGAHLDTLDGRYRSWLEPGIPGPKTGAPSVEKFFEMMQAKARAKLH
jgi:hypothetical protein